MEGTWYISIFLEYELFIIFLSAKISRRGVLGSFVFEGLGGERVVVAGRRVVLERSDLVVFIVGMVEFIGACG